MTSWLVLKSAHEWLVLKRPVTDASRVRRRSGLSTRHELRFKLASSLRPSTRRDTAWGSRREYAGSAISPAGAASMPQNWQQSRAAVRGTTRSAALKSNVFAASTSSATMGRGLAPSEHILAAIWAAP
jgi:hypothetical protein